MVHVTVSGRVLIRVKMFNELNNKEPKQISFMILLQILKPIHHLSQISWPSKMWRRHEPHNLKEQTVLSSARFIPDENIPAHHFIWYWAFWVQYRRQKLFYRDLKTRTISLPTPGSQDGVPDSIPVQQHSDIPSTSVFPSLSLRQYSIPVNSLITDANLIRKSHRRAN
jgi:hypothetical protein